MRLIFFKALQSTLIFNIVFQYLPLFLFPLLQYNFNTSLKLGYYIKLFWNLITIAMQKLYKNNYMLVKVYWLIIIFDTIRKTFESILAKKISTIIKIHQFLFNTYFGKRKNILTEHVAYFLIKKNICSMEPVKKSVCINANYNQYFW